MTRSELLHAAEVCVCGQREEDYGTPEDSFRVIGELWETYIKEKCVGDPAAEVCIVPEDVARCWRCEDCTHCHRTRQELTTG